MSTYGVTHGVPVVMQKMLTLSFNERIEELSDFQRNAHHKPRGLDLLGSCHQHGNGGLEKDEAKAVELQAAACGYAEGQSSFGLHVWNWHRRPQRQRGADRLCSLAASQPHDSRLHSPRPAPQRGPRPLRSSLLRRHPPGRGRSPWAAASRDSPGGTLLGKDAIYSSEEEAVLDTVLRWVGHDQQARGQQLEALMDLVNLDAVLTATLAEASKSPVVRASDMAMKLVTVMGSALSGNEHPAKCAWHAPRERDTHNMRQGMRYTAAPTFAIAMQPGVCWTIHAMTHMRAQQTRKRRGHGGCSGTTITATTHAQHTSTPCCLVCTHGMV